MIKYSQKELVDSLEKQGLKFSHFSFISEGNFLPSDADWNYKDVPHLNVVHQLVDAVNACIGDDIIATINMQKILGIRFPLSVFNYDTGPNRQTYFANFFVYQLIIETSYIKLDTLRTQVTTRYAIGSAPIWQFFVPILKWVIRKNYDDLMSTDIPMRTRRGDLRAMGYTFKGDNSTYSFRDTMKIQESNLIPPSASKYLGIEFSASLSAVLEQKTVLLGKPDHLGLRLELDNDSISVFLRTCPHEGANLDESKCAKSTLSCPWHARKFRPLLKLSMDADQALQTASGINASVKNGQIRLSRLSTELSVAPAQ